MFVLQDLFDRHDQFLFLVGEGGLVRGHLQGSDVHRLFCGMCMRESRIGQWNSDNRRRFHGHRWWECVASCVPNRFEFYCFFKCHSIYCISGGHIPLLKDRVKVVNEAGRVLLEVRKNDPDFWVFIKFCTMLAKCTRNEYYALIWRM